MLDHIDRQQRNKLKLDNLSIPSPERHRPLRHQFSSDNMHVPPFNIPNLRIDQRKTSSAEDMARKNSAGEIIDINLVAFSAFIVVAKEDNRLMLNLYYYLRQMIFFFGWFKLWSAII